MSREINKSQKLEKENHQNFHESFMKDERPFDGNITSSIETVELVIMRCHSWLALIRLAGVLR